MVVMETKIKHFKILKYSFGRKLITDNNENLNTNVMSMVSMETKTQFDKSAIRTQQKFISSINFSIIFKIKSANFPIVNYFR